MAKCAICKEQNKADELSECPCGRKVCAECQERIYTDETCCKVCAAEARESWAKCPQHEYEAPYENDDGDMIQECKHCSYPKLVSETASEVPHA